MPQTPLAAYSAPPDFLAGFKGPLRGRRGMEGGEGRTRGRRRGRGEGKGRERGMEKEGKGLCCLPPATVLPL